MAKHKLLRQRINKEAWELKEFSARELQYKINNYKHRSIVENPSKSRHKYKLYYHG